MKSLVRFALVPSLVLALILLLLSSIPNPARELWHQYDPQSYLTSTVKSTFHKTVTSYLPPLPGVTGDKAIVMAKISSENTDWVSDDLADWRNAIYTVDSTNSPLGKGNLTTPANKGHEAMAYLTYLIDNYFALPAIIAFIHPHRDGFFSSWHTDTAAHSNVDALRTLNLSFVAEQGYVNLRCNWGPGCRPADRENAHVTPEIWSEVFERTSTPQGLVPWPGEVAQACCAQFAVARERVLKRPVGDYEMLRNWLLTTELEDRRSGRVMEFLWHVIFGSEAVSCPEEKACYCQVYGRC